MKVYGPYKRKDKRSIVIIHYDSGRKITKSYPRYLYEQFHSVQLKPWEDIHHKDEDVENNAIDNLEVISTALHMKEHSGRNYSDCVCPECGLAFRVLTSIVTRNIKENKDGPFCCKSCAGRWNSRKRK